MKRAVRSGPIEIQEGGSGCRERRLFGRERIGFLQGKKSFFFACKDRLPCKGEMLLHLEMSTGIESRGQGTTGTADHRNRGTSGESVLCVRIGVSIQFHDFELFPALPVLY